MKNATIKVGIYKSGANCKAVCECDVIGKAHKVEEAVYIDTIGFIRDPRDPFTDDDINKIISNLSTTMNSMKFAFKVLTREEADKVLEVTLPTNKWEVIREFSEV